MSGKHDGLTKMANSSSAAAPLIAMNPAVIENPADPRYNPAAPRNTAAVPGIGSAFNAPADPLGRNHVRPSAAQPSVGTTK